MKALILLTLVTLTACKVKRAPNKYFGLPEVRGPVICDWQRDGNTGTCICDHQAYICISREVDGDDARWFEVTCAATSRPLLLPEKPNDE